MVMALSSELIDDHALAKATNQEYKHPSKEREREGKKFLTCSLRNLSLAFAKHGSRKPAFVYLVF
jgi:hypothetical protein